jgi:hypothetical protein
MKRLLALFLLGIVINACDDGDLEVENIDFTEVTATICTSKDVVYKIKDSEMLLIEIPASTFANDQTPEGTPISIPITSSVKVKYRQYNGSITADNICPTIPNANPSLQEEWNATAGTIQITTTAIKSTNQTTGATRITGYRHYIVFKNITFEKPDGVQTYETYVFGNYNTTVSALPLNFGEEAQKSTCDTRVFNISGSELLTFNTSNYASLFENVVTTTPRTALINFSNTLSYNIYNNVVNNAFLCTNPLPTTPVLLEEWNAVDGVENVSGIIEITTNDDGLGGVGFRHTIRLKKVTLKKGNSDFYLGDDYLLGSFIVAQ